MSLVYNEIIEAKKTVLNCGSFDLLTFEESELFTIGVYGEKLFSPHFPNYWKIDQRYLHQTSHMPKGDHILHDELIKQVLIGETKGPEWVVKISANTYVNLEQV